MWIRAGRGLVPVRRKGRQSVHQLATELPAQASAASAGWALAVTVGVESQDRDTYSTSSGPALAP